MPRMIMITIECPTTKKWIATGTEMHDTAFESLPDFIRSVRCPLCGRDHQSRKRDARLTYLPAAEDPVSKRASRKAMDASSRETTRPEAATRESAPKANSYRFFLFDGAGHSVRMKSAECEDAANLSNLARDILDNEELTIRAIEAWDPKGRVCRVERAADPSSKQRVGSDTPGP